MYDIVLQQRSELLCQVMVLDLHYRVLVKDIRPAWHHESCIETLGNLPQNWEGAKVMCRPAKRPLAGTLPFSVRFAPLYVVCIERQRPRHLI
jgi:hypothetical protein